MRILLLAPIHNERDYLKQKSKKAFVEGQGQQSWVDALHGLGHKVEIFKYTDPVLTPRFLKITTSLFTGQLFPLWSTRVRRFFENNYYLHPENYARTLKLLLAFRDKEFDLIIISGGITTIFPRAIRLVKNDKTCIVLFSGVNPATSSTKIERMLLRNTIDLVVENDSFYAKKWKELGAKDTLVLPISGVDQNLHKKVALSSADQKMFASDICFVGSLTRDRQKTLEQLLTFDLKIWGDFPTGATLFPSLEKYYMGNVRGKELVKAFNGAKIVLNFQPEDMKIGGNMRTFEIAGCGAFQIVDRYNTEWFAERKEIVVFKNMQDLKRKISYYLNHEKERSRIANAGYKKAHQDHTYEMRFKKLFSVLHL